MFLLNPARAIILGNMPPSDFKDFMYAALRLYTDSIRFLQYNCFSTSHNDSSSNNNKSNSHEPKDERCMKERQMTMAKVLINRYDDLGRHYGWVLAGDHACVDQALRGICEAEKHPNKWLKELIKELEDSRTLLEGLQLSVCETGVELEYS